jgi:hypothetical protein
VSRTASALGLFTGVVGAALGAAASWAKATGDRVKAANTTLRVSIFFM